MRMLFCLSLLLVGFSYALDVDSLPVWDQSYVKKLRENLNVPESVPEDSVTAHANVETHGYKTMQVTVGDGGTQVDQELRLSIQGKLTDSVRIEALLSDVDRKAGDQTTATLQEVDQIYFRVESPWAMLHLGDLKWTDDSMELFSFNRSTLGAMGLLRGKGAEVSAVWGTDEITRYTRSFAGVQGQREGYALDESGSFISVVPNSEKVWLNGVELVRDRDYDVNYAGGLLNFKGRIVPGIDDEIRVEYDAYKNDDIFTMYAAKAAYRHPNFFFDLSGFRLENDVDRMRKNSLDSADYERLKQDGGGILKDDSLNNIVRPKRMERAGARLRFQGDRRFYADLEFAVSRKDSNIVSDKINGPEGMALRWLVTTDSSSGMERFPVAMTIRGSYVDEGFGVAEFKGNAGDWDAYQLRNDWDLDSIGLNGNWRYDEIGLRIRLGRGWLSEAEWGYRRGDDERWNSSRTSISATHANHLAKSSFGVVYVSSQQDLQRRRLQGLLSSEFLQGFWRPFGNADFRYTEVDSVGYSVERGYGKVSTGFSLVEDNWNLHESVGSMVVRTHDKHALGDWSDSLKSVSWTQTAEMTSRYLNLNHMLQFSRNVSDSLGTSDSWIGELSADFGGENLGIQGAVEYKLGMTSEQTYTAIYKAVAKGTGDVRFDSLTGAYIEGVDNGDFVYEGMGRNDSLGAVLSSNASFNASVEWNPGTSLGVTEGILRDITLGVALSSVGEDTTGKRIYFPPVSSSGLRKMTSGTVAWEGHLDWRHPSGWSLSYKPGLMFDKKMSSVGFFQNEVDHRVTVGFQINDFHFATLEGKRELVELSALQNLDWVVWDVTGRYRWNVTDEVSLTPRVRYRTGFGDEDSGADFDAYLWEEEIGFSYKKDGVVDGNISFAAIQTTTGGDAIPYQMMSGFNEGRTFRLSTSVSVEINHFLSLSCRYVLRFGNAEENVFQKLSSEAKAFF